MDSGVPFELPVITNDDIQWVTYILGLPENAFCGADGTDPRKEVLKDMTSIDVSACPGSGKTTLLVAKLAILANKWKYRTKGICVLSHTNAARDEIEKRIGHSAAGRSLLAYPHFIGTIHGFVDQFLTLPWLRSKGYRINIVDTDICQEWRWKYVLYQISLWPRKFDSYKELIQTS
jgi:superfamily I DNA/RNA helicase